jgi:hypothetical protein
MGHTETRKEAVGLSGALRLFPVDFMLDLPPQPNAILWNSKFLFNCKILAVAEAFQLLDRKPWEIHPPLLLR